MNSSTSYLEGFGKLQIVSMATIQKGEYRYCGNEEDYMIYEREDNGFTTNEYVAVLT